MKFNWLISGALIGLLVFTSNYAAESIVGLITGAETEPQMYRRGLSVAGLVFLVWFVNTWIYTITATLLPLHPFFRDSLLFFRKNTNAMFIVFLSLVGYFIAFIGTGQYGLAVGSFIASAIAWEKVRFPFDFYKAHVVEYEGHLEESKKKSKKPLDKDHEDQ